MAVDIEKIKDWFTFAVAVVTCIAGVIFWVQHSSDDRIARVEADISALKQDIDKIESDSREILRIVGRLEGLIDK
tara:strand:+ start:715 stop:939 length:225 start_codon:yes stop_codon:yes gene_type:complete